MISITYYKIDVILQLVGMTVLWKHKFILKIYNNTLQNKAVTLDTAINYTEYKRHVLLVDITEIWNETSSSEIIREFALGDS